MKILKEILRLLLACLMVGAGVMHFLRADIFLPMVPPFLPAPALLVYVSGVFEILGGVGLLIPFLSRQAAWGLIALYIAVFPANVHMAINNVPFNGEPVSPIGLWLRLPIQFVLIAWAWWYTRPKEKKNYEQ